LEKNNLRISRCVPIISIAWSNEVLCSHNLSAAVINLGCKLNQFEGESIAHSLHLAGYRIEKFQRGSHPDLIVVNTCTVTNKSDRKSRNLVFKAAEALAEGGKLIVTGCYAETNPDELKKIKGVDLVVGNRGKSSIPDRVRQSLYRSSTGAGSGASPFGFIDPAEPNRSRVFVKVQDGCSMGCSYCKVPLARGHSQSRDYREVLSSVRRVVENGYREVVLTGINLGAYQYQEKRLHDLIAILLHNISGDFRIRLSSIEPVFFRDELLKLIGSSEKIVPHFHIPLQSGSDRVLRLMKRPYTASFYLGVIEKIRRLRPFSHIAADVIVGFPSETEEDFRQTVKVIQSAECASLHVFKYSEREGTKAALLKDGVQYQEKVRRSRMLISLGEDLHYRYRKNFLGSVLDTVIERHKGSYEGITDNYIRVKIAANAHLAGERLPVKIQVVERECTCGEIVS